MQHLVSKTHKGEKKENTRMNIACVSLHAATRCNVAAYPTQVLVPIPCAAFTRVNQKYKPRFAVVVAVLVPASIL